tara:strand:+ start:1533 stop:2936 length:1404 start_codon:yes stop_codon:yes gene_type:complete
MTRVNIQSATHIVQRLVNRIVARSDLSDITPASALMQILGATSIEMELCYLELAELLSLFSIETASGDDLDALGKLYLPDAISRRSALVAFGAGVFTLVDQATSQVVIPAGAELRNPSTGKQYLTIDAATILVGNNQSNRIKFVAIKEGESGNCAARSVTEILSGGSVVNGFAHTVAAVGGRNLESDKELRTRIKGRVSALAYSTPQSIEARVLDAKSEDGRAVISSRLIEDETDRGFCSLYIDDGTTIIDDANKEIVNVELITARTDGGERVFFTKYYPIVRSQIPHVLGLQRRQADGALAPEVALTEFIDFEMTYSQGRIVLSQNVGLLEGDQLTISTYTRRTSLIADAQRLIEGDSSDPDVPTYRAAGVVIEVMPAEKRLIALSGNIITKDDTDRATVLTEVRSSLSDYLNTLPIGGDVIISELIEQAMRVSGMYDFTLNTPTDNIAIGFNQVARALFDQIEVI